jgi:SAM-dependent methyltransferase
VLTVDYGRLGVRAGDRLLDLGCGGGRHAFEAFRRGARVVALDRDHGELHDAASILWAMRDQGQAGPDASGGVTQGDALALPFPDGAFDRVIAAEVLEHIPRDTDALIELTRVLRPGGTMAVTVPSFLPERVCWALADDYHAPAVRGGHVRIYRRRDLVDELRRTGLTVTGFDHAHALHTPYWWLKCAVGVKNDDHPLARAYHRFLVWDMVHARSPVRLLERALNPVLGKSLVVYATKPAHAPAQRPVEIHDVAA